MGVAILWMELLAIVAAVELWTKLLTGKSIILRSDNTATVSCIKTMKSEHLAVETFPDAELLDE